MSATISQPPPAVAAVTAALPPAAVPAKPENTVPPKPAKKAEESKGQPATGEDNLDEVLAKSPYVLQDTDIEKRIPISHHTA